MIRSFTFLQTRHVFIKYAVNEPRSGNPKIRQWGSVPIISIDHVVRQDKQSDLSVDSKRSWRQRVTLMINRFLDFVYSPVF
jgi:hypothetical protein